MQTSAGDEAWLIEPHATRLVDHVFPRMHPTPFGAVPVWEMTFPSAPIPTPIPPTLAQALGMPAGGALVALDVETASRVGGSRHMPFVIGLGLWSPTEVVVRQIVLRSEEDERAALWTMLTQIGEASILTYNGSRFDLPLLRARGRALGEPLDLRGAVVDLEPFVRARFRGRRSGTLRALEDGVLCIRRLGPQDHPMRWEGQGLDTPRRLRVARVLAKNAQDVLSLFWLFGHLCEDAVRGEGHPSLARALARRLEVAGSPLLPSCLAEACVGPEGEWAFKTGLRVWKKGGPHSLLRHVLAWGVHQGFPRSWEACILLAQHDLEQGRPADARGWVERGLRAPSPPRARRILTRYRQLLPRDGEV